MSANPFGIFASTINGTRNLGYKALRGMTADRADRIFRASVTTISLASGLSDAEIEEEILDRVSRTNRWRGITDPMALVFVALACVESELTRIIPIHGAGEGFESANPVQDCRYGNAIAAAILDLA